MIFRLWYICQNLKIKYMIGAIIGAVGAIGSAVAGGIMGAKADKKRREERAKAKAAEQSWYNREYNADESLKAANQRIMTKMFDRFREANKQAAATAAVMGGTDEAIAAQREQANQAMADAASQVAANGTARKDNISDQHMQNQVNFANQDAEDEARRRENLANVTQNTVNKVATGIAGSLDDMATQKPLYKADQVAAAKGRAEADMNRFINTYEKVNPVMQKSINGFTTNSIQQGLADLEEQRKKMMEENKKFYLPGEMGKTSV